MSTLFNLIHERNFHVSANARVRSSFINRIHLKKSILLQEVASYVNYGERLAFLSQGFQEQILSFFIANLALATVGKVSGNNQLAQDFIDLKNQDLTQKFSFDVEKLNHQYQDFIAALQTLQGKEHLTLADVQEFAAEFIKTYTCERTREVNGVEEVYEEESSLYTNRFVEAYIVQILFLLEDFNFVKRMPLEEIRTTLHDLEVNLKEFTNCSINSQEPLLQCNLVESKIATFNNPELMARWHALRNYYSLSLYGTQRGLDRLLTNYFYSLGYDCLGFDSLIECFERELEAAIEQATAQGHKQPEVVALSQLINRLEHVRYYFRHLRHSDNNEVRNLFLAKDRPSLSDEQLGWVKSYLEYLFKEDKVVVSLYYSYLDGYLNLADYLACLHAYWAQDVTNKLFSTYHNVKRSSLRRNIKHCIDLFEAKSRTQENNVEFVKEFVQACRDNISVIPEVPSKDPQELAKFLIYRGTRINRLPNYLLKRLGFILNQQADQNYCRFVELLVEDDKIKSSLRSLDSRREHVKYNELGNLVLIRNRRGLFACETQEERLTYIYANALENQQLPPAGTEITPEVLQQRSVALLTQIFEMADFDKTEHLQLS